MRMAVCDYCAAPIDLVADPNAVQVPPECIPYRASLEQIICESCREAAWERAQARAMEET